MIVETQSNSTLKWLSSGLNILSIVCSMVVVSSILSIQLYRPSLTRRISFRLRLWIALTYIFFSGFQLLMSTSWVNSRVGCSLIVWGYLEFTLASLFLTVTIPINLHRVFLKNKQPQNNSEIYNVLFAMVMSLMLTSPPYFLGFYGRSNNDNTCWIQGTLTRVTVLHWSILFSWMILSILYIFWVTLWTYQTTHNEGQKVKSDLPPIQYLSNNSSSNTSQSESLPCAIWDQIPTGGRIRSALRRITIYPFVWAILQSIFVIFGISSMLNRPGHNSRLVLVVLTAVHGIVHSVTFCWDPTVQVCLNTLSTDLLEQYHSRPRKAGLRSKLIYLFCKVIASEDQTKSLQDELLSQSNSDSGTRQSPAETLFANSKFDLTLKTPTRAHFFNQSEISVDQMSYSTGSQERKLKLGLI